MLENKLQYLYINILIESVHQCKMYKDLDYNSSPLNKN